MIIMENERGVELPATKHEMSALTVQSGTRQVVALTNNSKQKSNKRHYI